MMQFRTRALLFDMDGTLVDSDAVVEGEWRRFCRQYALPPEEVMTFAHGRQNIDVMTHYLGNTPLAAREAAIMDRNELEITNGIVPVPGAKTLLEALPPERWALVTSASRELAGVRMRAAGLPLPAVMICAEDVRSGKPDPEGYQLAAGRLGVPASECVIFEDALAGIQAGLASGARVITVGREWTGIPLSDRILANLKTLTITPVIQPQELVLYWSPAAPQGD